MQSTVTGVKTLPTTNYAVECWRNGELVWEEDFKNLVPDVGINEMLDKFWKGSAYTASFFVALLSGTPTVAAGDTMASHAGWTEITAYSEAVRQTLTLGTVASKAVNNSAAKAIFSINGTASVGGAFITTVSTKSGTTGVLVSAAAFTEGNRSVISGDEIRVTASISSASA